MGIALDKIAAPSAHTSWQPDEGDTISGTITFAKIMAPKPNFDGDKMEQELRIDLVDEDGEPATVWAVINTDIDGEGYPSRLARAIASAVSEAGASELEEGGKLAIQRVDDIPPTKKGRHPAKAFEAAYKAPSAKLKLALAPDTDDDDGEEDEAPAAAKARPSAKDLLG